MNWYYAQGDERQGPVTDSELDALLAAGTINETTLVWKDGMANWLPLNEARVVPSSAGSPPPGWIRCTATGRSFPPEEIVYIDGKPYSAAAKAAVLQGVLQGGTLPSADYERTGPAWENREQLGFFPSIWQTIRAVLIDPAITFTTMKREGGLGTPLGFYALLSSVGGIATIVYNFGFQLGTRSFLPPQSQNHAMPIVVGAGAMVVWAVLMPVFLVITSFITAGIMHLSLMLCQGAKQPFETTYRAYCYAAGSAAVFQLIPLCGAYVGGIWGLVSLCIGIAKTHEINTGRAVLAVLLPTVVCCVAIIFIVVAVMGAVFAAQGVPSR